MEISADCPHRDRRSLTKMDRLRNVQSSVWTLQQILSDRTSYSLHLAGFIYPVFLQKLYTIRKMKFFMIVYSKLHFSIVLFNHAFHFA